METEKLIAMLARETQPVDGNAVARRFAAALAAGTVGAMILMALLLGLRGDLLDAARDPMFWVKAALPAAVLALALRAAARLARPGLRVGHAVEWVLLPVGAIWLLAAFSLLDAAPATRPALLLGDTWSSCPLNIAFLALPAFVGTFWAMKGLAPTRPGWAGAFSGLVAGSAGALVYCLHCPEMAAPFIGTWYVLGIALPGVAGMLLGPKLLRW
jgi:hypothetical protein